MRKLTIISVLLICFWASWIFAAEKTPQGGYSLKFRQVQPVPISKVKLEDGFWEPAAFHDEGQAPVTLFRIGNMETKAGQSFPRNEKIGRIFDEFKVDWTEAKGEFVYRIAEGETIAEPNCIGIIRAATHELGESFLTVKVKIMGGYRACRLKVAREGAEVMRAYLDGCLLGIMRGRGEGAAHPEIKLSFATEEQFFSIVEERIRAGNLKLESYCGNSWRSMRRYCGG